VNEVQLLAVAALALFAGSTLLLSHVRWFRRRPLSDRLAPYVPGGSAMRSTSILVSAETVGQVIGPLARAVGERVARAVGVTEPLAVRLERIGSPLDVIGFRVRQLGWAAVGLVMGSVLAVAAQLSGPVALLLIVTGPLIGFLVVEHRLAVESQAWQRRVFRELPVVAEQLGMLLSAGYSLGGGLGRLANRGKGACGRDLQRVVGGIRQGLSETEALREWAAVADVDALHRLVGVLALNRQSGDLGRLIGEEARAIRRDVHRELIETIERRGQQVWIAPIY
jgi:tight adherence protein C